MITSKQRAFLRSKANDLDAIFQVGKGGVNENLIAQLNDVLEVRELIKIKVLESSMLTAKEASEIICEATGAEPVQCIGTKLVIYKPSTKEPKIILPKA